jgi:hypothetical protein
MFRPCPWSRWLASLTALLLLAQTACGTLFYPERHGRRSGRVDPVVLILDGALLFFFVIPGLVAFAIDFYTGSVYVTDGRGRAVRIDVDPSELTDARIEAIVREHTGHAIRLDDPGLERFRVPSGTDAESVRQRIATADFDPAWRRAEL